LNALPEKKDPEPPRHVAIIMDGNGRWAGARGQPRTAGHKRGAEAARRAVKAAGCTRAILVGHNPAFDIGFVNADVARANIKRNPFHPFSTFDTATLAGLAYGQTVLSRAVRASGLEWDERDAHSAIYDAEMTAALFCRIVNLWGPPRVEE